jgi:hypothetical protein
MQPSARDAAMPTARGGRIDPTTSSKTRVRAGTSAFDLHRVDDASLNDVREGYLAARPAGRGTDTSMFGSAPKRRGVEVNGPTFGIRARRTAQSETYSGTLAAGRIMPSAMRSTEAFVSSARRYGVTGPGSSGGSTSGSESIGTHPAGSWSPPRRGRRS